eukprot:8942044-Pyramimonas_sp.AAC.1
MTGRACDILPTHCSSVMLSIEKMRSSSSLLRWPLVPPRTVNPCTSPCWRRWGYALCGGGSSSPYA